MGPAADVSAHFYLRSIRRRCLRCACRSSFWLWWEIRSADSFWGFWAAIPSDILLAAWQNAAVCMSLTNSLFTVIHCGFWVFAYVSHMGEGHISRGELRPHPSTPIFCCSLLFLCTLWCRTTKFGMVTHGEGLVLRGSATPPPQGAGLQRCPIFGVPSYLCVHLCCRTIKFDMVTLWGCPPS